MSLSFGGADASSARGSQPRSSDLAELSRSRAGRPAQAKDPPHKQMLECGKNKWHWPARPPQITDPMPLTFGGADASSARGSQPRSSDLAELSRSRAGRPAQAEGLPHKILFEYEKSK